MSNLESKIEEIKVRTENLTNHLTDYVETYIQLSAVRATEKATNTVAATATSAFVIPLLLFSLLFAGLGTAMWLGEIWENGKAGYFSVAGFYAVVALLYALIRKGVVFPAFRDYLIRKIYE